jgi:hypothetical protein
MMIDCRIEEEASQTGRVRQTLVEPVRLFWLRDVRQTTTASILATTATMINPRRILKAGAICSRELLGFDLVIFD